MPALAMCSMKGGTGKTTIAFNLAERAFSAGLDVLLVDYDPQEGSIGLQDLRDRDSPCWTVMGGRVTVDDAVRLVALRDQDPGRILVCDLPGADSIALLRLLSAMDLVLSPVGAGASDLLAAANFRSAVQGFDLPMVFLPNNISHILPRQEVLLAELNALGAEVCPVLIQRRVAHLDSLRIGFGVCELFPRSPAAAEVNGLWDWVCTRLGIHVSHQLSLEVSPHDSEQPAAYSLQG